LSLHLLLAATMKIQIEHPTCRVFEAPTSLLLLLPQLLLLPLLLQPS
jgi:hypothetical protein